MVDGRFLKARWRKKLALIHGYLPLGALDCNGAAVLPGVQSIDVAKQALGIDTPQTRSTMMKRDWDLLFYEYGLRAVLDQQLAKVGDEILSLLGNVSVPSPTSFLRPSLRPGYWFHQPESLKVKSR
jgi:hypothetical protein